MTAVRPLTLLLLLASTVASAQPRTDDVGAEALFREGRRLLKDGKIAEACDKLDASDRLAESVGTLLNLADCREKNAQLATAWATFLRAASLARASNDTVRESEARNRARALEPRLSYLTISVPASSHVEGLIIERDGTTVDAALWNQGVPIDAGNYEIRGRAPGHEPWSTQVAVGAGQKASVEVPRFKQIEDLSGAVVPKPARPQPVQPPPAADDDERDETRPQPHTFTTLRKVSIAAAAVGVIGIAVGVKYGLSAKDLQRQSDALCPARSCGDPHALDLNTQAQHDALASDVLFAAGGAAIAGGVVMWLVGAPAQVSVSADRVSVAIAGTF